jgi:hypothetical protein
VPLNVIGDLSAPPSGTSAESVREEAAAIVGGLLSLVGIEADPLSSREHILLANLLERAWTAGQPVDLGLLITQTMDPPLRKLGVFEVDTFFPPDDRRTLALKLNSLVASPSFAAWTQGAPLDVASLLHDAQGRPRASVIYLAHLSDAERQFVVGLVLAKLITWMRAQSGTTDLRAMLYMDEMFGFAPPTAEPPSKRAILTLLKQARAYGVGLLLSTQNPVDLDYKAMSNAGTWVIGRLQTERDKQRVLEGLRSASGDVDVDALDAQISDLKQRHFVLHNTHDKSGPKLFTTRWAMSYLRGPLTRDQIAQLEPEAPTTPGAPPPTSPLHEVGERPPTSPLHEVGEGPGVRSPVPPAIAPGIPVYYADPAAPWLETVGARSGPHLEAALAMRVHLRFDDTSSRVDHADEWEAIIHPLSERVDIASAVPVDYDARDFRSASPEGALYALPEAPLGEPRFFRAIEQDVRDYLAREQRQEVRVNRKLKLYSRIGESEADFARRCDEAAQAAADAEAAKLRDRYDTKMDTVRAAIERAQDRIDVLETDASTRRNNEMISMAGDILGTFLGGRASTRTIATGAGRVLRGASSRRGMSERTAQRLETAQGQLAEREADLEDLAAELADELAELNDRWAAVGQEVETVTIGLEKSDISVDEVALVWVPAG